MRIVKTPAPVGVYLCAIPLLVGAGLAGAGEWPVAIALLAIGALWYVVGILWFARRVKAVRQQDGLTNRDIVEIDYPALMRQLATGYAWLLAASIGVAILGGVVLVIALIVK